MNYRKAFAGVGAGATLLGATALIAVPALAQEDTTDDSTTDTTVEAPKALRGGDKLATVADVLGIDATALRERLAAGESVADIAATEGVPVDEVVAALVAAAEERLDLAVADERITQDEADAKLTEVEERITAMVDGELPFGFGHHRHGFGGFGLDAISEVLGLDAAELGERLRAGDTLADIAAEQSVPIEDLTATIQAEISARLAEAVTDGRLTQERADEMLSGLTERIDDIVNGEAPLGRRGFGPGGHGGFGPGEAGEAGFGGGGFGRGGTAGDVAADTADV